MSSPRDRNSKSPTFNNNRNGSTPNNSKRQSLTPPPRQQQGRSPTTYQQQNHHYQQNSSQPYSRFDVLSSSSSQQPKQQQQYQLRNKSKSPTRPDSNNVYNRTRSKSPGQIKRDIKRNNSSSRSPIPGHQRRRPDQSKSRSPGPRNRENYSNNNNGKPADMTVLVTRTDLYDSGTFIEQQQQQPDDFITSPSAAAVSPTPPTPQQQQQQNNNNNLVIPDVLGYKWERPVVTGTAAISSIESNTTTTGSVAICRVPPCPPPHVEVEVASTAGDSIDNADDSNNIHRHSWMHPSALVVDNNTPQPSTLNPDLIKYWNQRRRLFSKFDKGIELDDEGWFSVTPEQIADHVSHRMIEFVKNTTTTTSNTTTNNNNNNNRKIVVLDAFGGCGGNAISFAKLKEVELVICVDLDRSKLQRAANNASIYEIPANKIVFIECNVVFILQYCYRNGIFILDEPVQTPEAAMTLMSTMPPPCHLETYKGFQIGGIDLLPRNIDVVFLDPPWGGVDYAIFGKSGYDLSKNMWIQRPTKQTTITTMNNNNNSIVSIDDSGCDLNGFFDTFQSVPRNKQERKAQFNCGLDESTCMNGSELLSIAAAATANRYVIYDVPRNTNRTSIGQAGLFAGYYGNIKVEEHYLNGRLKTISAYFGYDWRKDLLASSSTPTKSTNLDIKNENNSNDNNDQNNGKNGKNEVGKNGVLVGNNNGTSVDETLITQSTQNMMNLQIDNNNNNNNNINPSDTAVSSETTTTATTTTKVFLPFLP